MKKKQTQAKRKETRAKSKRRSIFGIWLKLPLEQ
jgi:hypothetical protein